MVQQRLNVVGDPCPVPLLKVERKVQLMAPGESLVVLVGLEQAVKNIYDWALQEGHAVDVSQREDGVWDVVITKRRRKRFT